MKMILISGHAQHGKDTTAEILRRILFENDGSNVLITHYADLLKYVCSTYFGWEGQKNEYGRTLLQTVGTDEFRAEDPNFWVDFLARILKVIGCYWDYVIIPDVRFLNEISRMEDFGFDVMHLRVVRENFDSELTEEQKRHPSELELDDIEPDYYIYNSGDLNDLTLMVEEFARENLL